LADTGDVAYISVYRWLNLQIYSARTKLTPNDDQ